MVKYFLQSGGNESFIWQREMLSIHFKNQETQNGNANNADCAGGRRKLGNCITLDRGKRGNDEQIIIEQKCCTEVHMKVVLLSGGMGTRISEETGYRPKPMIEIGGMPILWHIMKEYSYYGFNEFIICAGYKQHIIKEWFADYFLHTSDITFDLTKGNDIIIHDRHAEPWKVTVVDTGLSTMTGGRIKRVQKYVGEEPFMMTYGDGVCDVNIAEILNFHRQQGKLATLTSVKIEQSKGVLDIGMDSSVRAFREKSAHDGAPINAGYMVLEPKVFDYIQGDDTVFERDVLERLADEGELMSYQHTGFWQCMDTKLEKDRLEEMWNSGRAPWKVWE